MTPYILSIIQILGWITAYPKNKRWRIKEELLVGYSNDWTNADAILSIFICFFLWIFIWLGFIGKMWEDDKILLKLKNWLDKKSKL